MQLGLLIAVITAITISEEAPRQALAQPGARLGLILLATFGSVLVAVFGSRYLEWQAKRSRGDRTTWRRQYGRLRRWHLFLWLAGVGLTLFLGGWPQLVRFNWHLDAWIVVRDLAVTAPIYVPLLFSWAAFCRVEWMLENSAGPRSDPAGSEERSMRSRQAHYVWIHARHHFSLCLFPAIILLGVHDLTSRLWPDWPQSDSAWAIYAVPLALLVILFPQLLCLLWRTERLSTGPIRDRIDELTRSSGVRCRDIRVWRTDHQIMNAAVAGLFSRIRFIFLSDALLTHLRDDELDAVLLHELGHVRRHHLVLRMMLLGLPLWIVVCVQIGFPETSGQIAEWAHSLVAGHGTLSLALLPGLAAGYAVLALGWYSRLLEHDADLCVATAGKGPAFIVTLDRLAYLCGDRGSRRGWLHPSTDSRIQLLQRAVVSTTAVRDFRRRVFRANSLVCAAWIAPLGILIGAAVAA